MIMITGSKEEEEEIEKKRGNQTCVIGKNDRRRDPVEGVCVGVGLGRVWL